MQITNTSNTSNHTLPGGNLEFLLRRRSHTPSNTATIRMQTVKKSNILSFVSATWVTAEEPCNKRDRLGRKQHIAFAGYCSSAGDHTQVLSVTSDTRCWSYTHKTFKPTLRQMKVSKPRPSWSPTPSCPLQLRTLVSLLRIVHTICMGFQKLHRTTKLFQTVKEMHRRLDGSQPNLMCVVQWHFSHEASFGLVIHTRKTVKAATLWPTFWTLNCKSGVRFAALVWFRKDKRLQWKLAEESSSVWVYCKKHSHWRSTLIHVGQIRICVS